MIRSSEIPEPLSGANYMHGLLGVSLVHANRPNPALPSPTTSLRPPTSPASGTRPARATGMGDSTLAKALGMAAPVELEQQLGQQDEVNRCAGGGWAVLVFPWTFPWFYCWR